MNYERGGNEGPIAEGHALERPSESHSSVFEYGRCQRSAPEKGRYLFHLSSLLAAFHSLNDNEENARRSVSGELNRKATPWHAYRAHLASFLGSGACFFAIFDGLYSTIITV